MRYTLIQRFERQIEDDLVAATPSGTICVIVVLRFNFAASVLFAYSQLFILRKSAFIRG